MLERTNVPRTRLRIAAIGDIHVSRSSQGVFHSLFAQISRTADVLARAATLPTTACRTRRACWHVN
jgi:hypothetical protein